MRQPERIQWPTNPKEGDEFSYICPISGCTVVTFIRFMNTWQFLKSE